MRSVPQVPQNFLDSYTDPALRRWMQQLNPTSFMLLMVMKGYAELRRQASRGLALDERTAKALVHQSWCALARRKVLSVAHGC